MKYRVPVSTAVQLVRRIVVEAADEQDAKRVVQAMIDAGEEPLTEQSVEDAMTEMRAGRDDAEEWVVGIVGSFDGIEIDGHNSVEAVKSGGA